MSMWVLRGAFASIFSLWTFSRTLLNLLNHGCRQKLISSELGLWKRYFSSWVHLYPTPAPVHSDHWQFLYSPPSMETLSAVIDRPIYPLPKTFSKFAREREITPCLYFCNYFSTLVSSILPWWSLLPSWSSVVLNDHWVSMVPCCHHAAD